MSIVLRVCGFLFCMASSGLTYAYDHTGHEVVAALAREYIAGSNAEKHVNELLAKVGPDMTMEYAARWADCVKGVNTRKSPLAYEVAKDKSNEPKYPECKPFESAQGQLLMENYVARNLDKCAKKDSACHGQYHYTDVAIQRETYEEGKVGKADVDIVNALGAAITVLKGGQPSDLFSMKDYEALMLLIHFAGDIHQPLHVGAIYIDEGGHIIDPDQGVFNPKLDNLGGNNLLIDKTNMHSMWDRVTDKMAASVLDQNHVQKMRKVPESRGSVESWPTQWANETLANAKVAFQDIAPSAAKENKNRSGDGFFYTWAITLPAGYAERADSVKNEELVKAGARLGQLLMKIWP